MDITGFNLSSGGFSINYKHHPHITLLYSDNCPFCRKIKPEWNKLEENYKFLIDFLKKEKPDTIKGEFIKNIFITSTMGISCKIGGKN